MLLALMLAAQAPTAAATRPDVIVTGKRLERLHELCREGRCSPLRDAQASIAWAEAQFRDGKYVQAKQVLREAAARNKRHAATDPKPVAAIYEAYATVSWQEGDRDTFRRAAADRVRTLRDNLPANDVAVRGAALALGDMWQRLGNIPEAMRAYDRAETDAKAAGQGDVALRARLARVRLAHLLGRKAEAARLMASAEALSPEQPMARTAVRAMRVRLAALDGDVREVERVAKELGEAGTMRPVLLQAPAYPLTTEQLARSNRLRAVPIGVNEFAALAATTTRPAEITTIQWADVAFWIRPDGRTAEVEILRGSGGGDWARRYLAQVEGRRYSATPGAAADDPGSYRLERLTLRPSEYQTPAGSLIRRRAGIPELEVIDLTDPSAKVTASR